MSDEFERGWLEAYHFLKEHLLNARLKMNDQEALREVEVLLVLFEREKVRLKERRLM